MERILDRILLSDLCEASDPFFLERNAIEAILYFGEGGMFPDDIKLYHRPTGPGGKLDPEQLADGIEFLREILRTGRTVLVIGATGATILTAFLTEMGFKPDRAQRMVTGPGVPKPEAEALAAHRAEMERRRSTMVMAAASGVAA